MKKLDTQAYVGTLRELVNQGEEVRLTISGNSMAPFLIPERDSIVFSRPDSALRPGDMVFYQRDDGHFVMHRIVHTRPEGLYIIGDNQTETEGPVRPDQVFARITRVCRKGRWITPDDFWWKFFATVWLHIIPLRHPIMRLYNRLF